MGKTPLRNQLNNSPAGGAMAEGSVANKRHDNALTIETKEELQEDVNDDDMMMMILLLLFFAPLLRE